MTTARPRAVTCALLLAAAAWSAAALADDETKADGNLEPAKAQPRITVSKETTRITEPLDEESYVDYVAALRQMLGQGVTPDNNLAVSLWRALGPGALELEVPEHVEFFLRIGIEPPPEQGDYLVRFEDFVRRQPESRRQTVQDRLQDQMEEAYRRPWNKEQFPELAEWLSANEKPLQAVVEGVRRDHYLPPMMIASDSGTMIEMLLPTAQYSRDFARLLLIRASLRVDQGDAEGAFEDLHACHRLGRLVGQGPTVIEALVAIAIDGLACQGDQMLAHHGQLTAEQATGFRRRLEQLPALPSMARHLDLGERFMFLDATQAMARNKVGSHEAVGFRGALARAMSGMLIDWNEPMRIGNRMFDEMVAAVRLPTRQQRVEAIQKWEQKVKTIAAEVKDPKSVLSAALQGSPPSKIIGQKMGSILVALLMPALQAYVQANDRAHTVEDLTRLTYALAAYHHEHGKYPKSLDQLAPKHIASVPKDRFTDQALKFKLSDQGYLLYSLGPNQADDQGLGPLENHQPEEGDDLAVRQRR